MSAHPVRLGLVGRTLTHYRINTAIGAGGTGEVYRASDAKLGREIALKVLPSDMAGDPDRLARFQREARAVAALNHPNVVTLYSVEESDGVHFLTMELIEGQSQRPRRGPVRGKSSGSLCCHLLGHKARDYSRLEFALI
jgi:serine/threonine protein kinase